MKTKKISILTLAFATMLLMMSLIQGDGPMTKEGKTYVVNTTSLTKKVRGYMGPTPLKIYIKGNKITKIEVLKNRETPQYFAKAKTLLKKYEGQKVDQARKMNVDAVTGATFSSKGLMKNVQEGLKYYKEHK